MEPDTDVAQQLIAQARSLHERIERVLSDRHEITRQAQRAAEALLPAERPRSPSDFTWSLLTAGDESSVAALRRDQAQPSPTPESAAWMEAMRTSLPTAISDAEPKPRGFLDRILGRRPHAQVQAAALTFLQNEIATSQHPDAARALQLPFEVPVSRPASAAELCRTIESASAAHTHAVHALPSDLTLRIRSAVSTLQSAAARKEDAAAAADRAAQAVLAADAQRSLADVDMDHFRSQITGRFPTSALAGAGIRTVADILATGTHRLGTINGISTAMATTLMRRAQDLQARAREQAQIDLTRIEEPALRILTEGLHAVQRHDLIHRDDAEDLAFVRQLGTVPPPSVPAPDPRDLFAPGLGSSPSLIVAQSEDVARNAAQRLIAIAERVEKSQRGEHLDETAHARLSADPAQDLAENTALYVAQLSAMGFEKRIVTNTHGDLPEPLIRLIEDVDLDTTLLTLPSLRRYQQFAAGFALLQKRVIIGDEMGLGKTVEALPAITHLHKQGQDRTLVICPASVLTNWMREIGSKTQLPAFRLHGPGRDEARGSGRPRAASASRPSRPSVRCCATVSSPRCTPSWSMRRTRSRIPPPSARRPRRVRSAELSTPSS